MDGKGGFVYWLCMVTWKKKKKVMPEQHAMYIGNESYKSWVENFAPNEIIIVESLIPCFSTFTFPMNPTQSHVCFIWLGNLLNLLKQFWVYEMDIWRHKYTCFWGQSPVELGPLP